MDAPTSPVTTAPGDPALLLSAPSNSLVPPGTSEASAPANILVAPATSLLLVLCTLHGNPAIASWLTDQATAGALYLTLNDPRPGFYETLPHPATVSSNKAPVGFAANTNAALARAFNDHPTADRAVIVNFDLDVPSGALERLAASLDAYPQAALVGAALVDENGAATHSVGRAPSLLGETTRALGLRSGRFLQLQRALLRRRKGDWAARNEATQDRVLEQGQYLPWACVAVRREAFEQVGPLDERFFMYCEDVDWGRRASAAGFEQVLVNVGPVVHTERATQSAATNAMFEQSNILLHTKYGQDRLAKAIRWCLLVRRFTPLRWLTVPLEWSRLQSH